MILEVEHSRRHNYAFANVLYMTLYTILQNKDYNSNHANNATNVGLVAAASSWVSHAPPRAHMARCQVKYLYINKD